MTTYGTNHFVSKVAAVRYYRQYGLTESDVNKKIVDFEIAIGKPLVKKNETLHVVEGRYVIQAK